MSDIDSVFSDDSDVNSDDEVIQKPILKKKKNLSNQLKPDIVTKNAEEEINNEEEYDDEAWLTKNDSDNDSIISSDTEVLSDEDDIIGEIEPNANTTEKSNKKNKTLKTKQTNASLKNEYMSDEYSFNGDNEDENYDSDTNDNNSVQSDEEEEEEEEEDDNIFKKINKINKTEFIEKHHPECKTHNYLEIEAMTQIIRDKDNIIIDPLHRTLPFLTKYEKARILGVRAKQIESGSKPFIALTDTIIESHLIAELELKEKKLPFIIRRPLPSGGSEYWPLRELEIL
jgi:DNA-directed RNA polymerase subunit K/omega